MSFFRNILRSQDGGILMVLIVSGVVGGIILMIMNWQNVYLKTIKYAEESMEFQVEYYAASETLFYAYKQEEQRYLKTMSTCDKVKPFVQALKEGSGCLTSFIAFKNLTINASALFSFDSTGCTIDQNSSNCGSNSQHVLSITTANSSGVLNPFRYYNYDFYIFGIVPEKNIIEFLVVASDITQQNRILGGKRKRTLALIDNVRNIAHIESNGRVTEENPSPTSRCGGGPWQELKSYNPVTSTCDTFSILGGAEGLAYYKGRYFGFRSFDGQVFDLQLTLSSGSIQVLENGTLNGVPVFPPYPKELLVNVGDITVIEDSIYYVAGTGDDAHIGVIDQTVNPPVRKLVCRVGQMGWGQTYEGILAVGRSQDVLDTNQVGNTASFYLKSTGGDLLTFTAIVNSNQDYDCFGLKDYNLQEAEYRRTYGFERTEDNLSIYYY